MVIAGYSGWYARLWWVYTLSRDPPVDGCSGGVGVLSPGTPVGGHAEPEASGQWVGVLRSPMS